ARAPHRRRPGRRVRGADGDLGDLQRHPRGQGPPAAQPHRHRPARRDDGDGAVARVAGRLGGHHLRGRGRRVGVPGRDRGARRAPRGDRPGRAATGALRDRCRCPRRTAPARASTTQIVLGILGTLAYFAVGSFTNVVIDRLPVHLAEPNKFGEDWDTRPWGEVFAGRSRCSGCGTNIVWHQNVPVVSWLALRGRCATCGVAIPGYTPVVELLCPLLFLGAVATIGIDDWRLLPALWLIPVGVAIAVIDLRTLIVPTRIVWPAFFVAVALS